jgi:hypothetical protein
MEETMTPLPSLWQTVRDIIGLALAGWGLRIMSEDCKAGILADAAARQEARRAGGPGAVDKPRP